MVKRPTEACKHIEKCECGEARKPKVVILDKSFLLQLKVMLHKQVKLIQTHRELIEADKRREKRMCRKRVIPQVIGRKECDTLGAVEVPNEKYYGAETFRSTQHFPIGDDFEQIPKALIRAYGVVKKAAAIVNTDYGLSKELSKNIIKACDELISGKLYKEHFPVVIWATATQTHMNVNEVIANRAIELLCGTLGSKDPVHPHDHVNMGQSTNDTFPSAMHIAVAQEINCRLLPSLEMLHDSLSCKSEEFKCIFKIARTHLQDAVPITLGQEFSGYVQQIKFGICRICDTLPRLYMLPLGGTAVGTGLNSRKDFGKKCCEEIAELTQLPFVESPNLFEAIAADDTMVEVSGALNVLATSYLKIANDIKLLCSGPRNGLGDICIPVNEPGSSIMGGKANPTQCDSACMVCAQIMGAHVSVTIGGGFAQLQLNTCKPMMVANVLRSVRLLADSIRAFTEFCVNGITANEEVMEDQLNSSLMIATALNPHIGYERATAIVKLARQCNITLKEAGVQLEYLKEEEYDKWVKIEKIIFPPTR